MARQSIKDGSALAKFKETVLAQGGDVKLIENTANFERANYSYAVKSVKRGYICKADAEAYGLASLALGAGRNTAEDKIDYSAGIMLKRKTGDLVEEGEEIATLYSNDKNAFERAAKLIIEATEISKDTPREEPLLYCTVE